MTASLVNRRSAWSVWLLMVLGLLNCGTARALTPAEVQALALGDSDARVAAIGKAALGGDPQAAAFLQALLDDAVKTAGDKVFVQKNDQTLDAVTGAPTVLSPCRIARRSTAIARLLAQLEEGIAVPVGACNLAGNRAE